MNTWNDAILGLLWTQFWQLTLVIVVIGLVVRLACRRRPHLAYMLWMVVLLKALTPALEQSDELVQLDDHGQVRKHLASDDDAFCADFSQQIEMQPAVRESTTLAAAEHPSSIDALAIENNSPRNAEAARISASSPTINPDSYQTSALLLFGVIWVTGALGYLIYASVIVLRVWRVIRRQRVAPSGSLELALAAVSRRLRLKRRVQLAVVDAPLGPLTLGTWRPRIVLPKEMLSEPLADLEPILAHELIHIRRHDSMVGCAQILAQACWWFHPLMWFVNRSICANRERCCDEEVIAELAYDPRRYGRSLLGVLNLKRQWRLPTAVPGIRSFEVTRQRLEYLVQYSKVFRRRMPRRYWLVLALGFILLVPGAGLKRMNPVTTATAAQTSAAQRNAENTSAANLGDPDRWSVQGRVVNDQGEPVADAEVLLLGPERIFVDAPKRTWFVLRDQAGEQTKPNSTRTNARGEFQIERTAAGLDRIGVIAPDPLFWVVGRSTLPGGDVQIKLPKSGSLAIDCDLPGKPATQDVNIELRTFDGQRWNSDALRFHVASTSIKNPGVTMFEHLPPGTFAVERNQMTKTGPQENLITMADRQLVQIEPGKQGKVRINRATGRPLKGKVIGLEKVDLRRAEITISYFGPEEDPGKNGKRARRMTAFDVIPIQSSGEFTTDPIPPGEYSIRLFAMKATTSNQSPQQSDFEGDKRFTIPANGTMPQVEFFAKPRKVKADRSSETKSSQAKPVLRVVDEEGQPVANFELKVWTGDRGSSPWLIDSGGQIAQNEPLWGFQESSVAQVTICAPGYAPSMTSFSGAAREKLLRGESTVVLSKGTPVQISFRLPQGMSWPAGVKPEMYFANVAKEVHSLWSPHNRKAYEQNGVPDYDVFRATTSETGVTNLRLAADTAPFYVAIFAPGFLRFFERGPFTLANFKNGQLDLTIDPPAKLNVHFDRGTTPPDLLPFASAVGSAMWKIAGSPSAIPLTDEDRQNGSGDFEAADLAAGDYRVEVRTKAKPGVNPVTMHDRTLNPGEFAEISDVTLKAGETRQVDFRYQPFDPQAFRGSRSATLRLLNSDGSPAAGRDVAISFFDGHYGSIDVFAGPTSPAGEIMLKGITDRGHPLARGGPYSVLVDNRPIGTFGFTTNSVPETFELRLAPDVGDLAPDIEWMNLGSGNKTRLSDLRGKLVCLEFWATWCGPCREPLQKLNTLADEKREAWKDRVVIVPLSIDEKPETVLVHVGKTGTELLQYGWSGASSDGGFQSPAAKAFVVNGVPTVFVIDRDGRILWRGHPSAPWGKNDLASGLQAALDQ